MNTHPRGCGTWTNLVKPLCRNLARFWLQRECDKTTRLQSADRGLLSVSARQQECFCHPCTYSPETMVDLHKQVGYARPNGWTDSDLFLIFYSIQIQMVTQACTNCTSGHFVRASVMQIVKAHTF